MLQGCCVYIDSCNNISLFQRTQICQVVVWDRPWTNQRAITSNTCSSAIGMPGGGAVVRAPAGEGAAAPQDTSFTVCIAFVGPSSSSKVTTAFSKIRERIK